MLCTMQGDVWHVEGLDASLENVRWRRFASGLHQALGLVVVDGMVHVLGRDQITRLHDLNGDGEADFYECVSNAYETSPAGHDFICGLQRDAAGQLLHGLGQAGAACGSAPDGKTVEVAGHGLSQSRRPGPLLERRADRAQLRGRMGAGVDDLRGPSRRRTTATAARKDGQPPDLPLVYLPRGLDNSSGGQVEVTSRPLGTAQGPDGPFLIRRGDAFPGPARAGRRPAARGRRALAR